MALPIAPPVLLELVLVGLDPLPVPEEVPELEGRAAGRVEEITEEVAGMETVAVPSSTW
jgi:hypothetical protein